MIKLKHGLTALTALSLIGSVCAWAADNGPDATIRRAYAVTIREFDDQKTEPPWRPPLRDKLMSKRLAGLFARDDKFEEESGDEGNLGFDPFIAGQDGRVDNLKVVVGSQNGEKATVFADFHSLGEQIRVEFSMVRENGQWVIDDIIDTMERKPYKVSDLLSQPYDCGSFMNKPCKR